MSPFSPSKPPPHLSRASLPTIQDDDIEATEMREIRSLLKKPRDRGLLTRTGGHDAGRVYALEPGASTIGRASGCTIEIDDAGLSRVHARIVADAGAYVLEDAGSLNGCYVNDVRVERAQLCDGDRVQLGSSVTMRFHLVDEDEQRALVRVYESSVRDGLTGVFNRRHLEERLQAELAYAVRHGAGFVVVMFDLDRFKHINDTHGHAAGDAVLKAAASLIASSVRTEDLVARYGGEEFVVLARAVPLSGGVLLAERIRASLEKTPVALEGTVLQVTASAGVASIGCCGASPDPKTMLSIADARLYQAKQRGRNRVVGAG